MGTTERLLSIIGRQSNQKKEEIDYFEGKKLE